VRVWGEFVGRERHPLVSGRKVSLPSVVAMHAEPSTAQHPEGSMRSVPAGPVKADAPSAKAERGDTLMDWAQLGPALEQYHERWGILDEELYGLCDRHPGHSDLAAVLAKVAIIGRTYATRIEATMAGGRSESPGAVVYQVAEILRKNGEELDSMLASLPSGPSLDASSLESIVRAHGIITMWLAQQPSGNAPKSFVSKYMHFHRPCVPIYDSY